MNRPVQLTVLGLCGILTLTVVSCRRAEQAQVETETQADTLVVEGETPAPSGTKSPTPAPEATPTPTPTPGQTPAGTPINPPQSAQLIANQPESRINLRSGPGTSFAAKGYGLVGDPVQLLRSTTASDGTWYYVRFEQSGAEGWIRSDFINVAGRATPLGDRAAQSRECEGLMEALVFTAYYDANGFHLVRFTNLETKNTFDSPLRRQGSNNQGQPLYVGSASPPSGGSYPVQLTDLSGGTPRSGSQVSLVYSDMSATGTCQ